MEMEKMRATQETMQVSLDKWAPLAPLADQPVAIPSKVVVLHSASLDRLCDTSERRVAAAVHLQAAARGLLARWRLQEYHQQLWDRDRSTPAWMPG
jgi:hypothetical protein